MAEHGRGISLGVTLYSLATMAGRVSRAFAFSRGGSIFVHIQHRARSFLEAREPDNW